MFNLSFHESASAGSRQCWQSWNDRSGTRFWLCTFYL